MRVKNSPRYDDVGVCLDSGNLWASLGAVKSRVRLTLAGWGSDSHPNASTEVRDCLINLSV